MRKAVTTPSNELHLIIGHGPRGPVLTVSKTPVPGSITITLNDYHTFCLYMLHIFRAKTLGSSLGLQFGKPVRIDDTLKAVLYFLYAGIARLVAPGLSEHEQLERTALALYSSNVTIPSAYYAIQRPIKEKSGALTNAFDPAAWRNTPGRTFFNMSVVQRVTASSSHQLLLNYALNAVEDLNEIKRIIKNTRPEELPILLNTPGTATITHLQHLNIQRTGTALQLALYGDDEDIVAYLETVMDPEEFERQSKEVYRNALSLELRAKLDVRSASALEYRNAMLAVQIEAAKGLCNAAFLLPVVDGKKIFTINRATIANFQQQHENYVRHNPIHNPAILYRLYKIYVKLPAEYMEDCLFSQNATGHAHALSSARWLQHYAQGIYHLGGVNDGKTLESPRRSFICRDSRPPVDIRSFIPGRFGTDLYMTIFGLASDGRAPGTVRFGDRAWPWVALQNLWRAKNSKLSVLVRRVPASLGV